MQIPDIRYARSGDVAIAYETIGDGPIDVVFARGFAGDLLSVWEQPLMTRFIEGLASFARVTMLDKRGTGLSDRVREVPTLETRMDDLRAVMDAVGSEQAILWTAQEGARLATLFAATYPERTAGLVLFDPTAKGHRTADYPWAPSDEEWRVLLAEIREGWGQTEFLERQLADWAPSKQDDPEFRNWFLAHMRRGLSPGSALAFFRMMMDSDVSDVLAAVRVPTIVLSSEAERGPAEYFAERIRGARLVELPPSFRGIYHWVDDEAHEIAMRETRRLVSEAAPGGGRDRVLATVLFTDIVDSTARAAELGDGAWRSVLERHHALVRRRLAEFRGEEIDTAGDGFFALFDGPGRAIACASAIVEQVRSLGLEVRAGIHTGECERIEGKLGGIAVPTGARIMSLAGAGEVLVSGTVRDLVAGSGIEFEDRGIHELKGVPGEWRLYAVRDS
ncbi:MAG TPA: adenylate/guanylate cyclase domain-containing protein [Gaiellaceae bacterium]|nr:adenylate/guanylate cyclase domain-containing protein [Gaiellaceae bacterium]